MIKLTFRRVIQLFGGLGAGLAIVIMVLAWQLYSGPVSLGIFSDYIVRIINSEQRAVKLEVDDTILTWAGWDRTLDIRVTGVKILRQEGVLIGTVPELSFSLSGGALISGLLAPESIELFRPHLIISRDHNRIDIGFSDADREIKSISHRLIGLLLEEPNSNNPMSYLSSIEVINAEITIDDKVLNKSWVAQPANINLKRDKIGLVGDVQLTYDINGRKTNITTSIGFQSAARRIDLTTRFSEITPEEFSSMFYELKSLRPFAFPVHGTITAGLSLKGAFEAISFDLTGGRGKINLKGKFAQTIPIEKLLIKGRYEGDSEVLDFDEIFLDLGTEGSVQIPTSIKHNIPLASVSANGRYLVGDQRIEINNMDLDLQGPTATLSLIAKNFSSIAKLDYESADIDFKGSLNDLPVNQLSHYWPSVINDDTRSWVVKHLSEGTIHKIRTEGRFKLDGDSFKLQSIDGDMDLSGVNIEYLPPLPSILNTNAYIKFDKENFNIFISSGNSRNLNISEAKVLITGLDEYDQIANITVKIDGNFADKLEYLDEKPLEYTSALGIDSQFTDGLAETELKLKFVVENKLTLDDIEVFSRSEVKDIRVSNIVMGRDINGGNIKILVNKQGMDVSGSIKLGTIPTELFWRENFSEKTNFKRRYVLKTHIDDSKKIAEFGLVADPIVYDLFRGSMNAEFEYTFFSDVRRRLEVKADISNLELSAPIFGWSKVRGAPGKASFKVKFDGGYASEISSFSIDAADLELKGRSVFNKSDGSLKRIDFEKIVLGRTNIKGALIAREDGGWDAGFHGASFELTPTWNDIFSKQSEYGETKTLKLPSLNLAVDFRRVWISQKDFLENVSGTLIHINDLWRTVLLKGETTGRKPFELTIRPSNEGKRNFILTSADAGESLKIMDFYDEMQGGKLEIIGNYNDDLIGQPLTGKLLVSNYHITDAPILARVLSVMSLTGVLDELEGGGLEFRNLEIPFIQSPGVLEVKDANASGTSIGFTASGTIYTYADVMDIGGTVVPAYVLNNALGQIPVIGELLIGGDKGSGLIAFNYSMNGPTDEPNITVNPLSALTPGIFRNVFDFFGRGSQNQNLNSDSQ